MVYDIVHVLCGVPDHVVVLALWRDGTEFAPARERHVKAKGRGAVAQRALSAPRAPPYTISITIYIVTHSTKRACSR